MSFSLLSCRGSGLGILGLGLSASRPLPLALQSQPYMLFGALFHFFNVG